MREMQRKHEEELAQLKSGIEGAMKANNHALSVELSVEHKALEEKRARAEDDNERLKRTLEQLRTQLPVYFPSPGLTDSPTRHASGLQTEDATDDYAPNTIIYGESGVGKSSIINLIADQIVARTSSGASGCTFQHERYIVHLDGKQYALWDTTGLEEGAEGTIPAAQAENYLKLLIRALAHRGGIHLLVYCIRAGRITKAIKRNYDLFYVAVCRKKVPIALVVTGLEHLEGDMDMWWAANEALLWEYGMRFDDHACVTTLNIQGHNMQERLSISRRILCGLVVKYSALPPWKIDPSFISAILPMLRTILRGTSAGGSTRRNETTRKVIICDMERTSNDSNIPDPQSSDATNPSRTATQRDVIGGQQYEFVYVDRRTLQTHTTTRERRLIRGAVSEAGLLVFCTSLLKNAAPPPEEFRMLEVFYEIAGGQTCPLIVVLQGCDDEATAIREFWGALASRHNSVQAFPTTPSNLPRMIERLFIEHIEVKTLSPSALWRWIVNNWERLRHGSGALCC